MSIGASGRSALIIAAGLLLGFAGPMGTTDSAAEPAGLAAAPQAEQVGAPVKLGKFSKHRTHKRHAARTRKPVKSDPKTNAKAQETTASAVPDSNKPIPLPPTIANANASVEMPAGAEELSRNDSPKTEASALANSAGEMLAVNQEDGAPPADNTSSPAARVDIVSSDEINEIDRTVAENHQVAPSLALASVDVTPPAHNADTGQTAANDSSTWNQTSLIGKIFIAFGGLLMIGSAARMFMA